MRKLRPRVLLKKNGTKNNREIGIAVKILFANKTVCSRLLCSLYENTIEIILIIGSAIMNPAKIGFLIDNQLAKAIIKLEIRTLKAKKIMHCLTKKIFYF